MKTFNSILLALLTLLLTTPARSLTVNDIIKEGKKTIEEGYARFSDQEMLKARGLFERALSMEPANEWALYYQFYTDYRLSIYYMQKDSDDSFDKYMDLAEEEGKSLTEKFPKNAEAKALMCSLYGIKISKSWMKAPFLGPKSKDYIEAALKLAPENPRVILQAGVSKFNTPGFFGGSKDKAMEYFQSAINMLENASPDSSIEPGWGYMEACAWLGMAYVDKKEFDKAVSIYEKALAVNPDYAWIKYSLLPAAKEQLTSK